MVLVASVSMFLGFCAILCRCIRRLVGLEDLECTEWPVQNVREVSRVEDNPMETRNNARNTTNLNGYGYQF